MLSLIFCILFQSLFAVLQLAWYHDSGAVPVYRDIHFSSSMCPVILIIIVIIPKFLLLETVMTENIA